MESKLENVNVSSKCPTISIRQMEEKINFKQNRKIKESTLLVPRAPPTPNYFAIYFCVQINCFCPHIVLCLVTGKEIQLFILRSEQFRQGEHPFYGLGAWDQFHRTLYFYSPDSGEEYFQISLPLLFLVPSSMTEKFFPQFSVN